MKPECNVKVLKTLERLSYVIECVVLDYMGEAKTELNSLVRSCEETCDTEDLQIIHEVTPRLQEASELMVKREERHAASILSSASRSIWKIVCP